MNKRSLSVFYTIGTIGWLALIVTAIISVFYRIITGEGDFMLPLILLALVAINFNLSTLIRYKQVEYENTASILEKINDPRPPRFVNNPYLN